MGKPTCIPFPAAPSHPGPGPLPAGWESRDPEAWLQPPLRSPTPEGRKRGCRRGGRGPNCGRDGSFLGLKRSHCFENQNTTPLGARPAPGSFNCPPPSWENCRLLRAWSGHDRDRVGLAGTQALPSAPTHRRARRPRHPVGRVQLRARSPPFGKGEALRGRRAGGWAGWRAGGRQGATQRAVWSGHLQGQQGCV